MTPDTALEPILVAFVLGVVCGMWIIACYISAQDADEGKR